MGSYYIVQSLRSLGLSRYEANFTASNVEDSQVQNLIQHSTKRGQRDCEWLESLIPEKSHRREFIQEFRRLIHIQSRISDARADISLAETESAQDEEEESEGEAAAQEEEEDADPVKISYPYESVESNPYNNVTRRNYNNLDHHAMFTQYRTPEKNSFSGSGSGSGSGAGTGDGDSSFLTSSFSVIDNDLSEMEGLEPDWAHYPSGSGSAVNKTSASMSTNVSFPRRWLQKSWKLLQIFSISGQILLLTISLITAAAFAPCILPHVLELTSGGLNVLNASFQTVYRNSIRYYMDVNVNYKSSIKSNFFHHDKEDYRDRSNDRDNIIETLIFYERVRSYQAFLLGPDDLDTLNTQYMIGDLLIKDQVELMSEAIRLLANVHNKRVALLGEEHPETLLAKVNLANALQIKDLIGIGKLQHEQWKQELQACDARCGQGQDNKTVYCM